MRGHWLAPLTIIALSMLSGCGCGWCDIDGFSCDRLVITVHDGVTRERVDEMNAEFEATVLFETSGLYGLQMPPECDVCDGIDFYEDQPEVASALPDSAVGLARSDFTTCEESRLALR